MKEFVFRFDRPAHEKVQSKGGVMVSVDKRRQDTHVSVSSDIPDEHLPILAAALIDEYADRKGVRVNKARGRTNEVLERDYDVDI